MDKTTLKSWFARGKKPTAAQFAEWMDSFWHKNEKLAISNVENLSTALNDKQDRLTFDPMPIAGSTNPVTSGGVKAALVLEASERAAADEELQAAVDNLILYPNNNPILSKNDNVLVLLDSNNDEALKITTSGISLEKDCTFGNLTGTSDSVIKTNVLKSVDGATLIQDTEDFTTFVGAGRPLILADADTNVFYGIESPLIIANELVVQYYGAMGKLMLSYDDISKKVSYFGLDGKRVIENDAAGIYHRGVNDTLLISAQYDQVSYRGFDEKVLIETNNTNTRYRGFNNAELIDSRASMVSYYGWNGNSLIEADSNSVDYCGWNGNAIIQTASGVVDYLDCNGNTLLESRPNSVVLYSATGNEILNVNPAEFTLSAANGNEIIQTNNFDFYLRDFNAQEVIERYSDRLLIMDKQGTNVISFHNDSNGLTISGIYEEVSMLQGNLIGGRTTPNHPYDFISLKRGTLSEENAPETITQTDNLDICISSAARIDGSMYTRWKIPVVRTRRNGVNVPSCELIIGTNMNGSYDGVSGIFRSVIKGSSDIQLVVADKLLTINAATLQNLATLLSVSLQTVTRDSIDYIEDI